MGNAFPSINHGEMDQMIDKEMQIDAGRSTSDSVLLQQRHRHALCVVTTADDNKMMALIGPGGLQGDAIMPEEFNQVYSPSIEEWLEITETDEDKCLWFNPKTSTTEVVQVATIVFADDIGRSGAAKDAEDLSEVLISHDAVLGLVIGRLDLKLNDDKKEVMAQFIRKNARVNMEDFYNKTWVFNGKAKNSLRYLGS